MDTWAWAYQAKAISRVWVGHNNVADVACDEARHDVYTLGCRCHANLWEMLCGEIGATYV